MPLGTPPDVAEHVITVAEKHELFAFDPQIGVVLTGPKELYRDTSSDDASGVGTVVLYLGFPLILLATIGYYLFF
jgi:hypothetical protein